MTKSNKITTAAEKRFHAIALQLADPNSSSCSEATIDTELWMNELKASPSSFTHQESEEIVRLAAALLVSNKHIDSKAASDPVLVQQQPKSVSLWDQFQGSSFSERVLWSDIQQALDTTTTPEQLLALLQKVEHIDDLLGGDWSDACSTLQKGLQQYQSFESVAAYLELHRKWFGQCQATAEYQAIRFDICCNVWQAASEGMERYRSATLSSIHSTGDEQVFDMLQSWQPMWVQIISQAGGDSDGRVDEMVSQVLQCIRAIPAGQSSAASTNWQRHPFIWMALVDPAADWFQCWLNEAPIARSLPVVESSSIVPVLVGWSQQGANGAVPQQQAYLKSLAMLSALVLQLRVRMFPWDQVSVVVFESQAQDITRQHETMVYGQAKDLPKSKSLELVLIVANAFLAFVKVNNEQHENTTGGKGVISVKCKHALEALLSGCTGAATQKIHSKLVELIFNNTNPASNLEEAA